MEDAIRDLLDQTWGDWKLCIIDLSSEDESLGIARAWSRKFPDRIAGLSTRRSEQASRAPVTEEDLFAMARACWAKMGPDPELGQGRRRPAYFLLLEPMYRYDDQLLSCLADSIRRQKSDLIIYGMEEDFVDVRGETADYDIRSIATAFYREEADPTDLREDRAMEPDPLYEDRLSPKARGAYRVGHQGPVYGGPEDLREVMEEVEEEGLLIPASNKASAMDFIERGGTCPFCLETEEEMEEELTLSGIRTNVKLLAAAGTLTVLEDPLARIYLDAALLEEA